LRWIFDGTLAEAEDPYDPRRIGKPIPRMINLVKKYLKQGKKVVILTARLNTKVHTPEQLNYTRRLIGAYTKKFVGQRLPSTAEKHHAMALIYDDRAVQVEHNTGIIRKTNRKGVR